MGSTDLTTPLEASGAASAGAVAPATVTPQACIAFTKAAQSLGITPSKVILNGLCLTNNLKSSLGDYPHFTFQENTLNTGAPDSTGQSLSTSP